MLPNICDMLPNICEIIFKSILDNLVFAAMLLLVGHLLKKSLEKSKSKLAFKNEIAKRRVACIGEVWSAVYQAESASTDLIRRMSEIVDEPPNDTEAKVDAQKDLDGLVQKSKESSGAVITCADVNRFWLGDKLYGRIQTYYNVLMTRLEAFEEGDFDQFKETESDLRAAKESVLNYTETPL